MAGLRIAADGFELPLDAITETIAILAMRGSGKALALDTPIPTPAGWSTMGDLKVGDEVLGADGRPTRVTFATEVQLERQCFEVTFSDGSQIVADAEHRWLTENRASRTADLHPRYYANRGRGGRQQCERSSFPSVVTTAEMLATLTCPAGAGRRDSNHAIRVAEPLVLPAVDLPIDPYLLGCWLGDGTRTNAVITTMDPEVIAAFQDVGYLLSPLNSQSGGKALSYYIGLGTAEIPFFKSLRLAGLLGNKHVPARYLRGSIEQRMELLRGLLDTDGTAERGKNSISFGSKDRCLADAVFELVVSLGMQARRRTREVVFQGKVCAPSHMVSFSPVDKCVRFFRINRKQEVLVPGTSQQSRMTRRMVRDIVAVPSVPVRCITVANDDHLYLAGRSMIPTHNTYSAAVIVEEVVNAGHPAVIIDPLGVWWGIRSSATGKSAGLPVVIFGGEHADLPLDQTQGRVIAEAIVEGRFPAIIDLSLLSKGASRRFCTDFLEALYQRNRQALMLVVDEADLLAPQRTMPDTARVLGAMEDVVRRGRSRGLGTILITQRPAVLNKDVLSQASVLMAMRMSGKIDVAAIDEWVRLHADEDEARAMKASLPSLPVGTCWVWSPGLSAKDGWPKVTLNRVAIRRRTTFDSSSTPKVGEARQTPTRLADIDLGALGAKLAEAREQAEANDPTALRRKVTAQAATIVKLTGDLERVKNVKPAAPVEVIREVSVPIHVEVPVIDQSTREQLAVLQAALTATSELLAQVEAKTDAVNIPTVRDAGTRPAPKPATPPPAPAVSHPGRLRNAAAKVADAKTELTAAAKADEDAADVKLKAGATRIVEAMARHYPQWLTKSQIGVLAKFKISGGTFSTYWGVIRRVGFVEFRNGGTEFRITPEGLEYVGVQPGNPLSKAEILEQWRSSLKLGARNMLDELVNDWPQTLTRAELADRLSMTASGGTFGTYLGVLKRNGLIIETDGQLQAADVIVERG